MEVSEICRARPTSKIESKPKVAVASAPIEDTISISPAASQAQKMQQYVDLLKNMDPVTQLDLISTGSVDRVIAEKILQEINQ